jgi:hypothetical protein
MPNGFGDSLCAMLGRGVGGGGDRSAWFRKSTEGSFERQQIRIGRGGPGQREACSTAPRIESASKRLVVARAVR